MERDVDVMSTSVRRVPKTMVPAMTLPSYHSAFGLRLCMIDMILVS